MTDQEKLTAITESLTRVAKLYGVPASRVRTVALHVLHSDSENARSVFLDINGRTFVRDSYIYNTMFELMASPEHQHIFEPSAAEVPSDQQTPEQRAEVELEAFFKSPEFLALDPVARCQVYDAKTAEARTAEKEQERKAVAEAVRLAASRIPDFQSWEPSRKSAFADRIAVIEREKARKEPA